MTAAHLVGDAHSESILISPVEGSSLSLPLNNGFAMIGESDEDDAEYDVIAYEVDLKRIPSHVASRARVIWLDRAGFDQWKADSYTATWFLFGYPRELNNVDYDAGKVNTSQSLLAGKYMGMSNFQRSIHELHVDNPVRFSEFAGFSGSPVMALQPRLASTETMRFCGIAISGTTSSGRVHFLESEAIADLLEIVIHRSNKFGRETLRGWA